jgi:hypothetical protein
MMTLTVNPIQTPGPDPATVLQQAINNLNTVIESKPDSDRLVAEMVRLAGQALQAGGAGVWVTETPDKPELILEHNLAAIQLIGNGTAGSPAGVIPGVTIAVRRCAREGKPLIVPACFVDNETVDSPVNPSPYELLFVPMKMHGKVALVLAMAVPPPTSDTTLHRTYLNFLARMVGAVEQTLTERHLSLIEKDRGTSNKLVRFADQVHKHLFLGQVAVDISNLVRDVMEAQRVTVELYPRLRKKVMAVSNVDEPNKRAKVFQVQRLIFDYVRDRHVPVVLDREAVKQLVSDPVLQDAASAYFAATEFNAFLAAPIKTDDPTAPVLGVLLVEYSNTADAQAHSTLMQEVARLCTGSVQNAIDVEAVPLVKAFHAARNLWRKPTSTKRSIMLSVAGIILIAFAIFCVIPFDFSIKADCQIRPSAQAPIVAPIEGRIVELPVRAGELVYPKGTITPTGQPAKPLAVYDSTEFVQQRVETVAKIGELNSQLADVSNSKKGDMVKIAAIQKQIDQAKAALDLVDHQISECTVWSPITGIVLTENVEQKRWSVTKKSEPLMEIASFSDWELVIDVPESEVATVRGALDKASRAAVVDGKADPGIDIEYILTPWPDRAYPVHAYGVNSLLPASMQSKSANVFRLEIPLKPADLPAGIALSGVTGRAKIHVGRKPLITQWTRGANRLLKMTIFF